MVTLSARAARRASSRLDVVRVREDITERRGLLRESEGGGSRAGGTRREEGEAKGTESR